jgi:hypothetical protein
MDPIITPALVILATRVAVPAISNSLKQLSESFSKDIRNLQLKLGKPNTLGFQPSAETFRTSSKQSKSEKTQLQLKLDTLTELNTLKAEHNITDQRYDELSQELELEFLNGHLTPETASKFIEKAKL